MKQVVSCWQNCTLYTPPPQQDVVLVFGLGHPAQKLVTTPLGAVFSLVVSAPEYKRWHVYGKLLERATFSLGTVG